MLNRFPTVQSDFTSCLIFANGTKDFFRAQQVAMFAISKSALWAMKLPKSLIGHYPVLSGSDLEVVITVRFAQGEGFQEIAHPSRSPRASSRQWLAGPRLRS